MRFIRLNITDSAVLIRLAVWWCFRFSPSFRDVDERVAQRGTEISYQTMRCWIIKFGPLIAKRSRLRRPTLSPYWHLDERVCWISGKRMYL